MIWASEAQESSPQTQLKGCTEDKPRWQVSAQRTRALENSPPTQQTREGTGGFTKSQTARARPASRMSSLLRWLNASLQSQYVFTCIHSELEYCIKIQYSSAALPHTRPHHRDQPRDQPTSYTTRRTCPPAPAGSAPRAPRSAAPRTDGKRPAARRGAAGLFGA